MKTSTTIKIVIITFFVILSNVSFGNSTPGKEVKSPSKISTVKTNKSQSSDLVGSKRGILPTMTITTSSRTYLV